MYFPPAKSRISREPALTFSVPWDETHVLGWLFTRIYILSVAEVYFFIHHAYLSFFVAVCLYFGAFRKCFQEIVDELHEKRTKAMLVEVVQFHVMVKE